MLGFIVDFAIAGRSCVFQGQRLISLVVLKNFVIPAKAGIQSIL
jgi:hypothetical protein